jgi:hypothetical protein
MKGIDFILSGNKELSYGPITDKFQAYNTKFNFKKINTLLREHCCCALRGVTVVANKFMRVSDFP